MSSRSTQRRISDVQRELAAARDSERILTEQVAHWQEEHDSLRLRALVAETPLATQEYESLSRHLSVAVKELERRHSEVAGLEVQRDALLREWKPGDQ
jgi:predicted  nucleic acid-binding Zn-ribbon protein